MLWVFALILLLAPAPARADEVVLKSGGRFTGRIESATDTEVVIVTDIGRMSFPRRLVAEIHRDEEKKPAAAPAAEVAAKLVHTIPGIASEAAPAVGGDYVALVRREGGVVAVAATTGKELWSSDQGGKLISGVAADPGGVYVATTKGDVIRLELGTGRPMWSTATGYALTGAPLLHRRGVFVASPGRGLVGLESATGKVRGLLRLEATPDTPLAAAGSHIVFGEPRGHLLVISMDGDALLGTVDTGTPFASRPLAISIRNVVLGGRNLLSIFDPESGSFSHRSTVPGLTMHPLGADAAQAWAPLGGILTGIDLTTGRIAWRAPDAGRVVWLAARANSLVTATADGHLVSVDRSDGRIRYRADLGAPAASSPVVAADRIFVVTKSDECRIYQVVPSGEVPPPEKKVPASSDRRVHSPAGFSLEIPTAWSVSEEATRGVVMLGLRPDADAPRFLLTRATEEQRRRLSIMGAAVVVVAPSGGKSLDGLAAGYVEQEKAAAERGGYEVLEPKTTTRRIRGVEWRDVRLTLSPSDGKEEVQLEKHALVREFGPDRTLWLELRAPQQFAALMEEDFEAIAGSLTRDEKFTPGAEVVAAGQVLAALASGDRAALLRHLADSLAPRVPDPLPPPPGALSLVLLDSRPAGRFREVRVRIDTKTGTTFTLLRLGAEGGKWVVVDAGSLLP